MRENLREQVKLFSSIRAAQRALARCMHPSRLVAVRESGRQLLIELQTASDSAERENRPDSPAAAERLERINGLLGHQIGSTLEILSDLDFAQLRTTGPMLCAQHPEEIRALIDVMLLGDLNDAGYLSVIEFLVTMVCTGSRAVVGSRRRSTNPLPARAREGQVAGSR